MSLVATAFLAKAGEAFIGKLVDKGFDYLGDKLVVRLTYSRALGAAIHRYATTLEHLKLARPLMRKDGPLSYPDVAEELSQIVYFEREPDYQMIGRYWRDALESPPPWRDFAEEARLLVACIEHELRMSEAFRPVFEARDLHALVVMEDKSIELLADIEVRIEGLAALLDSRFGELVETFGRSIPSIREQIRDFSGLVEEKTRGFVGREWVFDKIDAFLTNKQRGYLFIIGDPGIGKSALVAEMVKRRGYVHHFNIRTDGISTTAKFLSNVCAQLIASHGLEYAVLPRAASDDGGFLNKLLCEVSDKLAPDEQCVIVVDALDEVNRQDTPMDANLLCLPLTVPEGIFFVVSMREDDERRIMPRVDCDQDVLRIDHDSSDNLADIADFVQASTVRPGIQSYLAAHAIETQDFVAMMVDKSEGNFMYLHHVLPEIARGAYKGQELEAIPQGLKSYYEDHWRRMRGADEEAWFEYKLPVLVALTAALEPVSKDLLVQFSGAQSRARVGSVLHDWEPFLHDELIEQDGKVQHRYRLYHASFFEFIAAKQEVEDERVDLKTAHEQIANSLCADLGLDEVPT